MNEKDRLPKIHPSASVGSDVFLGDWSVVGPRTIIEGDVEIGRAAWITSDVIIGGGQKELGSLRAGDFLHLGVRSFINIADRVTIGNEVGLGVETKLYTHGGYLSVINGFPFQRGPIKIGSNVWLPNAMVLPNVKIGSNVVVAAMSLVNKDLPNGCLAGGVPVKVIRKKWYPTAKVNYWPTVYQIIADAKRQGIESYRPLDSIPDIIVGPTIFNLASREIKGPVTKDSEQVRDLLRRQGIRFRYYDKGGMYAPWD